MNLKYHMVPASKEMLKRKRKKNEKDGGISKEHRGQPEKTPNGQSRNNLNRINNDSTSVWAHTDINNWMNK